MEKKWHIYKRSTNQPLTWYFQGSGKSKLVEFDTRADAEHFVEALKDMPEIKRRLGAMWIQKQYHSCRDGVINFTGKVPFLIDGKSDMEVIDYYADC